MEMKRIGWFTTGRGLGSLGLFSTVRSMIESGEIDAKLSFVFMNREVKGNPNRAKLIAMAEEDGVPVIILPSDGFRNDLKGKDLDAWRVAYGKAMRDRIAEHPMDFGVLAGYMLILDPETCMKHDIINLHPALPGTYQGTWEEIVRRVAESDDETYGSMVHVCTPELDRGATVAYDEFGVDDLRKSFSSKDELASALRERQRSREVPLLMETVKMLTEGRVALVRGRLMDAHGRPILKAPNLASSIDRNMEGTH
jgi:phosphoribosylglycinamide formyltransferase-1